MTAPIPPAVFNPKTNILELNDGVNKKSFQLAFLGTDGQPLKDSDVRIKALTSDQKEKIELLFKELLMDGANKSASEALLKSNCKFTVKKTSTGIALNKEEEGKYSADKVKITPYIIKSSVTSDFSEIFKSIALTAATPKPVTPPATHDADKKEAAAQHTPPPPPAKEADKKEKAATNPPANSSATANEADQQHVASKPAVPDESVPSAPISPVPVLSTQPSDSASKVESPTPPPIPPKQIKAQVLTHGAPADWKTRWKENFKHGWEWFVAQLARLFSCCVPLFSCFSPPAVQKKDDEHADFLVRDISFKKWTALLQDAQPNPPNDQKYFCIDTNTNYSKIRVMSEKEIKEYAGDPKFNKLPVDSVRQITQLLLEKAALGDELNGDQYTKYVDRLTTQIATLEKLEKPAVKSKPLIPNNKDVTKKGIQQQMAAMLKEPDAQRAVKGMKSAMTTGAKEFQTAINDKQINGFIQTRFSEAFSDYQKEVTNSQNDKRPAPKYEDNFKKDAHRGTNYKRKDKINNIEDKNPIIRSIQDDQETAIEKQAVPLRELTQGSAQDKRWEIPLQIVVNQRILTDTLGSLMASIDSNLAKTKWTGANGREYTLAAIEPREGLPLINIEVHRDPTSKEITHIEVTVKAALDIAHKQTNTPNGYVNLEDIVQIVKPEALTDEISFTMRLDKDGSPIIEKLKTDIQIH